ncbi:MAG: nucleotidyltransferase domain-containing protein [Candidatus Shapirobacteria bacterium]
MINVLSVKNELEVFLDRHLGDDYFGCIYGSYAVGTNNDKSDVDLFIASSKVDKGKFEKIKNFVIDFHRRNQLSLDEEVPYENKLFVDYKDVKDAAQLGGFDKKNDLIVVPAIQKNIIFLSSRPIRLRLIFNALTTPHIFFGRNEKAYFEYKLIAEKNLCFLSSHLSNCVPIDSRLDILLNGPNGVDGEMFLGYKKYPKVIDYLSQILNDRK